MSGIKPSPASVLRRRARELRAAGRDIIELSSGNLDFPTPDHVIAAAHQAALRGETRYTDVDGTPELKQAVAELTSTLTAVQDLARKLDAGVGPAAKQLPEVTAQLGRTLANADKLVQSVDNAYGDNTKFSRDLERTMAQLNDALRSVRALADLQTRHPEALIKGRPAGGLE